MKVCTVEEMRTCDRRAVDEYGVADHVLMENAGEAVYYAILREIGVANRSFAVVCGAGNNGGDGCVVARKLLSSGARVRVYLLGDPEGFGTSARSYYDMLEKSGAPIFIDASPDDVAAGIAECDVVLDGIFGTGIAREVGGRYREVIERINAAGKTVVAIDIPSGIGGDTGEVLGVAVEADLTVTFGMPKRGNLLYPGADHGGKLLVTDISYPPELVASADIAVEIVEPVPLPRRQPGGHKGSFGDVLFVAGAASYYGAPYLASLSLLKAGGGYSRLAAPRSVTPVVAGLAPEVVFAPQAETDTGSLALASKKDLLEQSAHVDFVVLGPGVSLAEETQRLVRELASAIRKPLLVDGDGLTALASDPDALRDREHVTVLTPHPGEAARLLDCSTAEVQADPVHAAQECAARTGAIVVLKGAHSLVALPGSSVTINTSGNSGMATAGSGDVLTGTIAAMHGLGLELPDAVRTGVFLHGYAGDLAAQEAGKDGITARDVLEALPYAVKSYREQYDAVTENFYGALEVI
jgi:NAD(P)H-hydrate epimerase